MKAVDYAISFCNSKHSFFEPDLILCGDDAIFKIDCCNISHEDLAELVDPVLGVGEEGPAEFLLASTDDGQILSIEAEFF